MKVKRLNMLKTVFLMIVLTDSNGYESLHASQHSYETIEQCQSDLDEHKGLLLSLYDNSFKVKSLHNINFYCNKDWSI